MFFKKTVTIVTHSGNFHSDDIFAVATISLFLGDKYNIKIIRTRDPEIIKKADYVVDVGGIYNKDLNRFDHHQGTAGSHKEGIPFASFGLVWEHFGLKLSSNNIKVFEEFKRNLVLPIDAKDNGIDIYTINSKYNIDEYSIRNITWSFRSTWKENDSVLYDNFIYLVSFAKSIIKREVIFIKDNLEADNNMDVIYKNSKDKRLLILDKPYSFERFVAINPDILLVIYPTKSDNTWAIECARDNINLYQNRIYFPESWAGKRDLELEKETGIKGSVFCHKIRFIFVAKTKEAVLEASKKVLN